MKLRDLLQNVNILKTNADLETEISGISYDSRSTRAGDIFVAIRGFESDGHKYIGQAVKNGAACVLCEEEPEGDVPHILAENSRRALARLSINWFGDPASQMKIIGLTGTNGKTTTAHLIKTLVEELGGGKTGLIGTNHNMIGSDVLEASHTTPESYELHRLFRKMLDAGCRYVVMEVSSHALSLDRVHGINFEIGIFTNLTRDHLDFHKTMEEYGAAKARIFSQSRIGIINLDDGAAQMMTDAAECPVYTYSIGKNEADLAAKNTALKSDSVTFTALTIGRIERVRVGIPGLFSVYNALAAMAAAINLGFDFSQVAEAIGKCEGVKGRAEVVPTGEDFTVLIDYAHTPDALENILKTVRDFAPGRVVLLFGCGGDRDRTKRPKMGAVASNLADFMIITSDNPRTEDPEDIIREIAEGMQNKKTTCKIIVNRREAIQWAIENAKKDDIIILAGKGHETYQIIGREKSHFDEREVVAEILQQRRKDI